MKKPELRFEGFDDDWEQRKLGDCVTERVESMPEGELISVTINDGIKKFSELGRHDNSNDDKSKYKKVCVGDIAYNSMRMWQGASGCSPYEGIVSPAYTVLSPKAGINSKCLAYQFKLPEMMHTFQINSQGITSDNWNLKYPALSEREIFVSRNKDEQDRIAECFDSLDHFIKLYKSKLDTLQSLKKSMLEKMFPKEGETKPEIRFEGFTDDWEQRKFGDLGSVAMCKRIFKEQTSTDGDIPFYKIGTFGAEPDAFISRELFKEYREKFQYPNIGDMLISASGTIGRTVEYKGEEAYFQDSNIVWFKHDDRVDNSFLKCIYEIVKWSGIEGSTIKRLYNDNFLKTEFSMPKVAEQQQIGMYFQSLDHLITLHQRKLESLKHLKSALLDKMFA